MGKRVSTWRTHSRYSLLSPFLPSLHPHLQNNPRKLNQKQIIYSQIQLLSAESKSWRTAASLSLSLAHFRHRNPLFSLLVLPFPPDGSLRRLIHLRPFSSVAFFIPFSVINQFVRFSFWVLCFFVWAFEIALRGACRSLFDMPPSAGHCTLSRGPCMQS